MICAGDPITTEAVRYGMRVGAVVLPANPILKTAEALKFVGPKAFGFDIPYMEPRPLPGQQKWSTNRRMDIKKFTVKIIFGYSVLSYSNNNNK